MAHYEKTLESTTLFEGRVITLKVDKVELENGNTATREYVVHNGGVAVLALDADGCILFVSQFRYPFHEVLLELPAGKLELGENPMQCGMRELEEECGCTADRFVPLGELYPTCAYDTEIIRLYFAEGLHTTHQHLDADEFLTVQRIPVEEAVEMVLQGKIPDSKTQIAILRFKALRDAGRI